MRRGLPPQTPSACPFAELELLNGLRDEQPFGVAERAGIVPWKGARGVAVLEEVPIPALIERSGRSLGECRRRHVHSIKDFVIQSQAPKTHGVVAFEMPYRLREMELDHTKYEQSPGDATGSRAVQQRKNSEVIQVCSG